MNFLDRTQTYIVRFNEETECWECVSEDLQREGICGIGRLALLDQDMAPALAMLDCAGYDTAVIGAQLGLWEDRK